MQGGDLVAGPQAQPGVQVRERLVEEEDTRVAHHRASQRHPLPLSPGQLPGTAAEQFGQSQHLRRPPHPLRGLFAADTPHPQPESQILRDRHVRIERVALEDHRHVAVSRRDIVHVPSPDPHLPRVRLLEPRDEAQQGTLPAPRRSHQHHQLAGAHLEVDGRHGGHVAEALFDAAEDDVPGGPWGPRHRLSPSGTGTMPGAAARVAGGLISHPPSPPSAAVHAAPCAALHPAPPQLAPRPSRPSPCNRVSAPDPASPVAIHAAAATPRLPSRRCAARRFPAPADPAPTSADSRRCRGSGRRGRCRDCSARRSWVGPDRHR